MVQRLLLLTILFFLATTPAPAQDAEAARDALLDGVQKIHGGVQPGRMVVWGPTAFAVANYAGGIAEGPVVAAAEWGDGRVVALPDHQVLQMDSYGEESDAGAFYLNAIRWIARSDAKDLRIAPTGHSAVRAFLTGRGYTNVAETRPDYVGGLADVDVIIGWLGASLSDEELGAIAAFVRGGGGLLLCEYGVGYDWWWKKPRHEAPGNRLLREVGIGFPGGHRWDDGLVEVVRAEGPFSAEELLAVLRNAEPAEPAVQERAATLLDGLYGALPPDHELIGLLDVAFEQRIGRIFPTPATPVRGAFEQALLRREQSISDATPVEETVAHRTAEAVYGEIPEGTPRVVRTLTLDASVSRWHGTGLYAAPGDRVVVTVPTRAIGRGFAVQVSGHVDGVGHHAVWLRMPSVSRRYPIDAERTVVASPFGGALYLDVGERPPGGADLEVTIDGALEAPCFRLGETTDEEWATRELARPAPFAELCSEHLCISLPKAAVRDVASMTELMTFWDQVVAFQDELAGHGHLRTNAERINIDVQISAGGAHAGYPVQGPALWGLNDLAFLRENGSWGWFHELGHESQRRPDKSWGWDNPYTFDGSVEATVNIFSVYTRDRHGIRAPDGWGWTSYPIEVMKQAQAAVAGGGYPKVGVGQKLAMFLQLRDGFGWDALETILRSYDEDQVADPGSLPRGDDQEREEFFVRASRATGHDLTRFLRDTWRLEIRDEAVARVADLPDWMPALGGLDRAAVAAGEPVTLDLSGQALSLDGVHEISRVGPPACGELAENGDGTWTYRAQEGFEGEDRFEYVVTSSTGHDHLTSVTLAIGASGE